MSERSVWDDFRDLAEERLAPDAAASLRARIDADPALAAEFDAFREIHAFTAAAPVPASSVTAQTMVAALRRTPVRRLHPWMAAAAALLVAASAGAAIWIANAPHTVVLRAIALELPAQTAAATPASVPSALAGYRPIVDDRVQWFTSLATAKDVARVTNRPIFLWLHHPQCPMCVELDRGAFRDPGVEAKAAEFVPVRVDVMKAPEDVQRLAEKGWPYFGLMTSGGDEVADFSGMPSAAQVTAELTKALESQASAGPVIPWPAAGDAAAAIQRGAAALDAKRYADAHREFTAARALVTTGTLAAAADAGLHDVARRAAVALLEAKKLAATDAAAGARSVSEAAESFRGTPFGTDLAEVEQELRATGRFPVLVEATSKK